MRETEQRLKKRCPSSCLRAPQLHLNRTFIMAGTLNWPWRLASSRWRAKRARTLVQTVIGLEGRKTGWRVGYVGEELELWWGHDG